MVRRIIKRSTGRNVIIRVVCTNVETPFVAVAVNQNRIRRYVHERLTSLAKKRKSQSNFDWLFLFSVVCFLSRHKHLTLSPKIAL